MNKVALYEETVKGDFSKFYWEMSVFIMLVQIMEKLQLQCDIMYHFYYF